MFSYLMQEIIRNNHELLTSERINEFDKERMKSLYRGAQNEVELQNALTIHFGMSGTTLSKAGNHTYIDE